MEGFRKYYLEMARNELAALNAEGLEMIRKIIADLAKDGSEYSARTSAARLEEMRRERERAEKEQQAREAWEAERQKNVIPRYERNETMKILGKQSYHFIFYSDPTIHKMYDDLMEAERQAGPRENRKYNLEMDLHALAFLSGIRVERQKKRKVAPVQQEAKSRARATQAGQGQGRKGKADK